MESSEEAIPFKLVEEEPSFMGGDANTFSKWTPGKQRGQAVSVTLTFTVIFQLR